MPGVRITEEDRKTVRIKFICTLCNLLLWIPFQTACGHLVCQSCVFETLLNSSNPVCPECGEELSEKSVFPDAFTKRELNAVRLHCVNFGCSWHGAYESVKDHSQVCEHALVKCVHPQCQMELQRSQLGEHVKSQCDYRNVKCNHCRKDVLFTSMKEHLETICENAPVACKYCEENLLRKDIEKHEKMFCHEVPASCEFHSVGCNLDKPLKRRDLRQHLNDRLTDHSGLLLRYTLTLASQIPDFLPRSEFTETLQKIQDDITEVRSGLAEKSVMVVGNLTGLERRVENLESSNGGDTRLRNELQELNNKIRELTAGNSNLRERNTSLEREVRDKISIINCLVRRMDQMDQSLVMNTVKITDLESRRSPRCPQQPIHSYTGTLVWKIEGYQKKRQDAINGVKTALYSPPFYSAQDGYKMCAKIYLNGDGDGKGTHLSLYIVVMKGDYDALQTWPLQKKITMMLLDQGNRNDRVDQFNSDPQSSSFQRPKSDMNIASGSPLFMPLDSLNDRQYIKDDVMFIKVIVDP